MCFSRGVFLSQFKAFWFFFCFLHWDFSSVTWQTIFLKKNQTTSVKNRAFSFFYLLQILIESILHRITLYHVIKGKIFGDFPKNLLIFEIKIYKMVKSDQVVICSKILISSVVALLMVESHGRFRNNFLYLKRFAEKMYRNARSLTEGCWR